MNLKCNVVLFLYLLQDGYCRIYETEDAVIVEADDVPESDVRIPRQTAEVRNYQCGLKNMDPLEDSREDVVKSLGDNVKIIGGHQAGNGEWPWIVAIYKGSSLLCGGTLIDNKHILTAAHCVYRYSGRDVAKLRVRLNEYDLKDGQHTEIKVRRLIRHTGFNFKTLIKDVAILTLAKRITFSNSLKPICLARGSQKYVGQNGIVIGWGKLAEGGQHPRKLMEVSIPILSNARCKQLYGRAAPGGIVSGHICAGRSGYDSCTGDSGGPLMIMIGNSVKQVGIVSYGIGCGKGQYPGVYTRVTEFTQWIDKNTAKY